MTRKLWISFGIPSFEHLKLLKKVLSVPKNPQLRRRKENVMKVILKVPVMRKLMICRMRMQYRDEGNNASTESYVSDGDEEEEINSEEECEHSQFHHDMGYTIVQTINRAHDLSPGMKEKRIDRFQNHDKTTATCRCTRARW